MRRAIGYGLIFSPLWVLVTLGLIFDTRDAAIGFGIVFGVLAVMGLGFYLLRDQP